MTRKILVRRRSVSKNVGLFEMFEFVIIFFFFSRKKQFFDSALWLWDFASSSFETDLHANLFFQNTWTFPVSLLLKVGELNLNLPKRVQHVSFVVDVFFFYKHAVGCWRLFAKLLCDTLSRQLRQIVAGNVFLVRPTCKQYVCCTCSKTIWFE